MYSTPQQRTAAGQTISCDQYHGPIITNETYIVGRTHCMKSAISPWWYTCGACTGTTIAADEILRSSRQSWDLSSTILSPWVLDRIGSIWCVAHLRCSSFDEQYSGRSVHADQKPVGSWWFGGGRGGSVADIIVGRIIRVSERTDPATTRLPKNKSSNVSVPLGVLKSEREEGHELKTG